MSKLIITRGLPGSGKSTWAKAWVAEDPTNRARVNRDDIRAMLHGGRLGTSVQEQQVTKSTHPTIASLLRAGVDVVADDTNLPYQIVRRLRQIAEQAGAGFEVRDFTDVPVDECIRRDTARDQKVGEKVIRGMWDRHIKGRGYPLPVPPPDQQPTTMPYTPDPDTPPAILVDVDGTVALMNGRSPYDMTRVGDDQPNPPVITVVAAMAKLGYRVVFCSGRTDDCRDTTEAWLAKHVGVPYEALHMRRTGDARKDAIVKAEIFDREIRHRYQVVGVFDDRDQVVRMWRGLGLTVFQVAEGRF